MLGAVALLVAATLPAAAANSEVRRTILTSSWATPSPDPTGIAVLPSGALLVVDSEVEETPLAAGKNMWRATSAGVVKATMSTLSFSSEPTDVTVDAANGIWYFSDDRAFGGTPGKIFVRNLGADNRYGTSDDTRRSFSTSTMDPALTDPEALAFGGGSLWVGDGTSRRIFRIQPGGNGLIEGGGDDVITSFNVDPFGVIDVEGIAYKANGNLLIVGNQPDADIVEVTSSGQLVRLIDLQRVPVVAPSGLAIGPSSRDPNRTSIYLTDRGVDNLADPGENDGRIFEIGTTAPPANLINNASFERLDKGRPDAWSANANFSRSSTVAHHNTYSGKHGPGAEATYSVRQTLASVKAGADYHFSGWVNIPATTDEFNFQIRVVWFGSDGATLGSSGINGYSASTAGWVEATETVVAPPGTIFGKLVMSAELMSATVYVDQFQLTSVP